MRTHVLSTTHVPPVPPVPCDLHCIQSCATAAAPTCHRRPLLLHAAAATAQYIPPPPRYPRLQPFAATRPTPVPPAFRAAPPRTHAPLRSDGLPPPTGFPHARTPPTARPHPIPTYGDAPQPTPSSPMQPILHGPIRGAWPPIKRLAAAPRVSLPHHAYRGATTRLVPPLRVSSSHYSSRPATTHVGPQPCVWLPRRPPRCCTSFSGPFRASRPSASAGYSPISGEYVAIEVHGREPVRRCVMQCMKGGNGEEWEGATTHFRGQGAGSPART